MKLKIVTAVLVSNLCLALPVAAQTNIEILQALDRALQRNIATKQAIKASTYHPVLGYTGINYQILSKSTGLNVNVNMKVPFQKAHKFNFLSAFSPKEALENGKLQYLQVAPVVDPNHIDNAFDYYLYLGNMAQNAYYGPKGRESVTKFAQAAYLWSWAHDGSKDFPNIFAAGLRFNTPATHFLRALLHEPDFPVKSYSQLLKETTTYPKHIILNEQGFPEPSPDARQAQILDLYLMQTPGMDEFCGGDTGSFPFVLTEEENQAAEQLKALRAKGDILPGTEPRQLLENIYNQMERELVTYRDWASQVSFKWETLFLTEGDLSVRDELGWRSHFPYAKTPAGLAIRETLAKAGKNAWKQSYDMAHLTVVDAIINKHPKTPSYYTDLIAAFKRMWNETPKTPENLKHLKILQKFVLNTIYYEAFYEEKVPNICEQTHDIFILETPEDADKKFLWLH